ncbi:MAG: flagellar FliJ family protein [Alphaproteobacteria bacterium]|nr:flagellar FliJ family protein [Alphaproteobacteria bacterium]
MSALPTLIRVAKWNMEEKRRTLVALETLMGNLNASLRGLDVEVEREQGEARRNEETLFFYGNYARRVINRRDNIHRSIEELRGQLDAAHQDVSEAFQEVRRYEIVLERQLEREAAEQVRRDQNTLDETSMEMYRREAARRLRQDRTRRVAVAK